MVCKLSGVWSRNRSIEAEAVVAQRSEFVLTIVFVNQWAASGEKQYEERYGQF